MRFRNRLLAAALLALGACRGATDAGPAVVTLAPTTFTALVAKAYLEEGNGPNGFYSQHNLWVIISPGTSPNAGVLVSRNTSVVLSHDGQRTPATAADIRAGDRVEVVRDPVSVGYGAVQSPPGTPLYDAVEVVILH
jgi:hypothetical protein